MGAIIEMWKSNEHKLSGFHFFILNFRVSKYMIYLQWNYLATVQLD